MSDQVVTIKQVATFAGVSVGTVSRVLNGYSNISPDNIDRVRQAVNKLGYRKCDSARLLAAHRGGTRQRTGNIGVLMPGMTTEWLDHPIVMTYMLGIEEACRLAGYHPLLEIIFKDESLPPRFLVDSKVDGVLIKGSIPPELSAFGGCDVPMVGMSCYMPELNIPQVMPDNHGAGHQVASYLWNRGHRRIAFVCNDSQHMMFLHRRQGVEAFMHMQTGGEYKPIIFEERRPTDRVGRPEFSPPNMSSLFDRLWPANEADRPTAIIAANDWMAVGVYHVLQDHGVRVGVDVSVIGFDNASICCTVRPLLTSYLIPIRKVAYTAAKMLIDHIESPQKEIMSGIQIVGGEMIERESVTTIS